MVSPNAEPTNQPGTSEVPYDRMRIIFHDDSHLRHLHSTQHPGCFTMTDEELLKRIEALRLDHLAAGSFISDEYTEEIIGSVYGQEADEKLTTSSSKR